MGDEIVGQRIHDLISGGRLLWEPKDSKHDEQFRLVNTALSWPYFEVIVVRETETTEWELPEIGRLVEEIF